MIHRYSTRINIPIAILLFILITNTSTFINDSLSDSQKYKVIRVVPQSIDQLIIINELYYDSFTSQLNFWRSPMNVGNAVDIMLQTNTMHTLNDLFGEHNITFKVIIDDVEKLIYEREGKRQLRSSNSFNTTTVQRSKRLNDDNLIRNKARLYFGDYHSYDTIITWLNDIQYFYPTIANVFTIGRTFEGRKIKGIKIGNPIHRTDKRIIWIDGGIHAREWASIHTVLYFIDQLISQYGVDPKITSYIDTLNFYIVPVVNPDGYEYSRSDQSPHARMWRKNRGKTVCAKDLWYRKRCCSGVDLNRNFDFFWGAFVRIAETGSSPHICSEIYHGSKPFSEPETRAIRDKLLSAEMFGKVDAFITLHTYSQLWIYPYGHQRHAFPTDVNDLEQLGKQAVKALGSVYGTKFRLGTGADILYPSSGGSDDWAKSKAGVKFVYLLELRPGEDDYAGFLLDPRQLIPTGRETWAGVRVVIDAIIRSQRAVTPIVTKDLISNRSSQTLSYIYTNSPKISSSAAVTTTAGAIRTQQKSSSRYNHNNISLRNLPSEQRIFNRREFSSLPNRRCTNLSPWCDHWIQMSADICLTAATYMQQHCALSCRYC